MTNTHDWEKLISVYVDELSQTLQQLLPTNPNEAELRQRIDPLLEEFCDKAGLNPLAHSEYTLATGRADAVFNRFVIEYERPGTLSNRLSHNATAHAVEQVKSYIAGLAKRQKHEINRIAGVAFDGRYIVFVRYRDGDFSVEAPTPVTQNSLERFLRWLSSLASGIALTAENLNRDFSVEQLRTQNIMRALTKGLDNSLGRGDRMVKNLFEQWRLFFSESIDYSEAFGGRKLDSLQKFARKAGLTVVEAERFFFCLHTYFALLVKLIAWLALSRHLAVKLGVPSFGELVSADSETLRRRLKEMESGGIFRAFGITNLLEGDFFAWYLYAWNEQIEDAIRQILRRLDEYEPATLAIVPEESRDLFKMLYHYLLPREIRHNLGEYYTPDWLAQRLLNQVDSEFFTADTKQNERRLREKLLNLRWLDPACGSGTFLLLIIARMKELGRELMVNERELLNAILNNVVGFDLNPLAVITARVNYLLAISDLLPYRKSEITIPVYLADSVRTPAMGENLLTAGNYEFPTAIGTFLVPVVLCTKERFDRFCDLLEESVRSELEPESFLNRVERELGLAFESAERPPLHGFDAKGEPIRKLTEHIKERARQLRKTATSAESLLWEFLRDRRLGGLKFRRQHPIGNFIVDFYCHEHRLIVELEGGIHDTPEQAAYDEERFKLLQAQGYTILRFRNEEVFENLESVLERILRPLPPTPSPDRRGGEGGEVIRELYIRILELHRNGMDGLWARLLKNNFAPLTVGQFDYIVGNPPWVNWEHLPDQYRQSIAPLWAKYELFPHRGFDAILGKSKDDISILMTYVVADKLLKEGGRLGFLITQSVFKTAGGGKGFRRFVIPQTNGKQIPLRVVHVDDMVSLQPFEGASNRTAAIVLEKGKPTTYPVPYTVWRKVKGARFTYDSTLEEVIEATKRLHFFAEPVDPNDKTSPWLTARPNAIKPIRKVLGKSDYEAHAGVYTGGANAVYWVEIVLRRPDGLVVVRNITEGAKVEVDEVTETIEPDLLYPLLRGRDVKRWYAEPSAWIIMVQDPEKRRGIDEKDLQNCYPRTYGYLKRFEKVLRERAAFKRYFTRKDKNGRIVETGPFYSMFDVGDYTFAQWKVVWQYIASDFTVSVVRPLDDKPVVPNEKLMLVACKSIEEAHYLCAILNSSPVRVSVRGFFVETQIAPHVIQRLSIPCFDPQDSLHCRLAELSEQAHKAAKLGDEGQLQAIEAEIDLMAAKLWGLTDDELKEIQQSLLELEGLEVLT
ncbi:MAG: DUF559 domain-containing protein [Armatimonadetes bacterium]|nr:DUF559 domain-containing protein [Armatimonadota bacterium]